MHGILSDVFIRQDLASIIGLMYRDQNVPTNMFHVYCALQVSCLG